MAPAKKGFPAFVTFVLVYTLGVILWGAYVRASGSGAGCGSHWPLCNGDVIPRSPGAKTLVEYSHRITSGLAWILALALPLGARRVVPAGHGLRKASWWVFFFMTTEALVGAGLVLFEMVADNPSTARGLWMAAHLINTFFLIAACASSVFLAWGGAMPKLRDRPRLAFSMGVSFLGILMVGVSGAIAALGDTLFPVTSLGEGFAMDQNPSAHLWIRLRVLHPLLAMGVGGWLCLAALVLFVTRPERRLRRASLGVMVLVVLQVGLGFLNLALLAPIWMQIVHLLAADLLLVAVVFMALLALHRVVPVSITESPPPTRHSPT
ncbi:MAG: COX15/CtaA family protein [Myxococcales bacterium]|nr:COX15/CtaA family protein [Myxococcales bacterium]